MTIRPFVEMFNVSNLSTIFTRNETITLAGVGSGWHTPLDLVDSRRFQFGFQTDW
jgi:hypothetical protein